MTIIGGWKLRYKIKKTKAKAKAPYAYKRRNADLSSMGYSSYKEYLGSDGWKVIRAQKLEKFPTCLVCPSKSSQVHHLNYHPRTLLGLNRFGIVTLCEKCHERIEFDDAGVKCDLAGANKRLRELAHTAGMHRWLAGGAASETRSQKKAKRKSDHHAGRTKT